MTISIIAAVAKNRAIGFQNRLLYWLPNDLKRFKQLTTGHTIIMGRRTFESLPKGALPNRRNIVLSRTTKELPRCECFPTLEAALAHCETDEEVYIIGGASVYRQALPLADRLCLTEIDDTPDEADTFFPSYDDWQLEHIEQHEPDEKHRQRYAFADYVRKSGPETVDEPADTQA
ncbi:MAG: dihydrofolate reductase [Prevotella sp.]|nr:dihydrofolate reductase [Prevotella sp.]